MSTGPQKCSRTVQLGDLGAQALPQSFDGALGHALAAQAAWPWQLVMVEPVNEPSRLKLLASDDWGKQAVQQL